MTLRRAAVVALAIAAAWPASAAAATSARFSMPTPSAGDVTLARALVVVTSRGHRLTFNALSTNRRAFTPDVRSAALVSFPDRGPRQVLVDMFVVLAAPIGTVRTKNPSAMRLRLRAGGNGVAIARLLVVPNALARDDDDCPTLSDGFRAGAPQPKWLMAISGARWRG